MKEILKQVQNLKSIKAAIIRGFSTCFRIYFILKAENNRLGIVGLWHYSAKVIFCILKNENFDMARMTLVKLCKSAVNKKILREVEK